MKIGVWYFNFWKQMTKRFQDEVSWPNVLELMQWLIYRTRWDRVYECSTIFIIIVYSKMPTLPMIVVILCPQSGGPWKLYAVKVCLLLSSRVSTMNHHFMHSSLGLSLNSKLKVYKLWQIENHLFNVFIII